MKLSKNTVQILENFTNVNSGIAILKEYSDENGTKLMVLARDNSMSAIAMLPERFTNDVYFADTKTFLSIIKTMEDPSIVFDKTSLEVSEGDMKTSLTYAHPEALHFKYGNPKPIDPLAKFSIGKSHLEKLLKLVDILHSDNKSKYIKISVEDGLATVEGVNVKNPSSNNAKVSVPAKGENHSLVINRQKMMLLSGDYDVEVHNGFVKFINSALKVEYVIGAKQ